VIGASNEVAKELAGGLVDYGRPAVSGTDSAFEMNRVEPLKMGQSRVSLVQDGGEQSAVDHTAGSGGNDHFFFFSWDGCYPPDIYHPVIV
jgi:ABC-type phosphate transport system substrate-binding protein